MDKKILVVEDDPITFQLLRLLLEPAGFQTLHAENGQEALDKIVAQMPDAVLLDVMMPIMDGFEFIEQIQANPLTKGLPIIVLSTETNIRSVQRAMQAGATKYLFKPIIRTDLVNEINSVLANR